MRRSDAILATSFVPATPTEAVSSSSERMASLMARAMVCAVPKSASEPATSRKASSMETGSTRGVKRRRMAMAMSCCQARYAPPAAGTASFWGMRWLRA